MEHDFDPASLTEQFKDVTPVQKILAPFSGQTVPLTAVPDPVFAEKLTGDGIAILAEGPLVLAPCEGQITLFFDTKHAFAVTTPDGIQVLVHIGLDTVILNGNGLHALKQRGDYVTAGTPVLELDFSVLKANDINMISPVLIVNTERIKAISSTTEPIVTAGRDTLIEYTR